MLRKFLESMMLNEDVVVSEPQIEEDQKEEREERTETQKRDGFFERTDWLWEALGKSAERMDEFFDRTLEKITIVPFLLLSAMSIISLFTLAVILSFNL